MNERDPLIQYRPDPVKIDVEGLNEKAARERAERDKRLYTLVPPPFKWFAEAEAKPGAES